MKTMAKESRCAGWVLLAVCLAACGDETAAKPVDGPGHADGSDASPSREASAEAQPPSDATDGSPSIDAPMTSMGDARPEASPTADATSNDAADAMSNADATDGEPPITMGSFSILALAELGGVHGPFVDAAKVWLADLANQHNLTIQYIENPDTITDAELSKYALVLQLNFPPWGWKPTAEAAFEKYMTEGRG